MYLLHFNILIDFFCRRTAGARMLFVECTPLLGGWVPTPDKGYTLTHCNGYLLVVLIQ